MTISVDALNATLIYEYLDKSEGGTKVGDNRLGAEVWNKFIDTTGVKGNKISYSIFKNRTEKNYGALVSLSCYIKRADDVTKQKIVDYLNNLEKEFDEKPSVMPAEKSSLTIDAKDKTQQTSEKLSIQTNPLPETPLKLMTGIMQQVVLKPYCH